MKRALACVGLLGTLVMVAALTSASSSAVTNGRNVPGHIGGVVRSINKSPQVKGSGDLTYHGGPVMTTNKTYAIYWVPSGYSIAPAYDTTINQFFTDVAHDSGMSTNVYATDIQYSSIQYNSTFGGSVKDTNAFPGSGCPIYEADITECLTDAQIIAEVDRIINAQGWTRNGTNMFFMFTPTGVGSCFDSSASSCAYTSYCAYHGFTPSGAIYANQPYARHSGCDEGQYPNGASNQADPTINVVSHEHNEAITDYQLNAWFDAAGFENGDKCAWDFGPVQGSNGSEYNQTINGHHYFLQQEYSNDGQACLQTYGNGNPPPTITSFTPTSGPAGTQVAITGSHFTGATSVMFNTTAATTFTVNSDTSINATVPSGATTGKISVTTPSGTGTSSTNFTVTTSSGCTDSWANTAGGDWSVGSNWSLGTPPGSSDNACITLSGTYTVAFAGSATVKSLQVGATSGTQTLQLASTCSGDAILTSTTGATVNARGVLSLTNADSCAGNATLGLSGGTLTNNGTVHVFPAIGGQRVVSGSVSNKKIVQVDAGTTLQVSGSFTQTGTGTFQPAIASAAKLGTLTAGGTATLAGKVKLMNPFKSTTLGQTFTLLTAASRSGTFSTAIGFALNASTGFYYLPTYSATALSAVTTEATLSVSPSSGPAGSSVTASGTGWPPGDKITVSFRDHNNATTTYPLVTADGSGNFSVSETVPAAAAAGAGTLSAKSALVGLTLSKTFTVG